MRASLPDAVTITYKARTVTSNVELSSQLPPLINNWYEQSIMTSSLIGEMAETVACAQYPPPMPKTQSPLSWRFNWFLKLYFYKIAASIVFFFERRFSRSSSDPSPTLTRRYPCRPMLEHRVFFPPQYQSSERLLPLYLNIHGGGFAFGQPSQDDQFCAAWANRTGMLVVSVDYRKLPQHPFPTATYDIAAIANAILKDEMLPVDTSRVAIGGFSAGGNLALGASQLPGLKGTIKAVVAYYPIVDFSLNPQQKLDARPYKGGPPDRWGEASWWLDWGYVRVGQNRRDPLLSPCFAKKDDLPPWICMIGAQWDVFRLEAQEMMHSLAGLDVEQDQEAPFERDTYKWIMAVGCSHGFTHYRGQNPEKIHKHERKCAEIYQDVHKWLGKSGLVE